MMYESRLSGSAYWDHALSNYNKLEVQGPPSSIWRLFGPLDFVLRALWVLRPCDPHKRDNNVLCHLDVIHVSMMHVSMMHVPIMHVYPRCMSTTKIAHVGSFKHFLFLFVKGNLICLFDYFDIRKNFLFFPVFVFVFIFGLSTS